MLGCLSSMVQLMVYTGGKWTYTVLTERFHQTSMNRVSDKLSIHFVRLPSW